jgi:hypothetical protein
VAAVLSKNERLTLLRLLKKFGNTRPKLASKRIEVEATHAIKGFAQRHVVDVVILDFDLGQK